jgi:hypothetical protein
MTAKINNCKNRQQQKQTTARTTATANTEILAAPE